MIPKARQRVERVPTLGPMAPSRMPRRLVKPATENPLNGLLRFLGEPVKPAPVRKPAP